MVTERAGDIMTRNEIKAPKWHADPALHACQLLLAAVAGSNAAASPGSSNSSARPALCGMMALLGVQTATKYSLVSSAKGCASAVAIAAKQPLA